MQRCGAHGVAAWLAASVLAGCVGGGADEVQSAAEQARVRCPDDGNPCTLERRQRGRCVEEPVEDGTSCGGGGFCLAGSCFTPDGGSSGSDAGSTGDSGGGSDAGSTGDSGGGDDAGAAPDGEADGGSLPYDGGTPPGPTVAASPPSGAPSDVRHIASLTAMSPTRIWVAFTGDGSTARTDGWAPASLRFRSESGYGYDQDSSGCAPDPWGSTDVKVLAQAEPEISYSFSTTYANGAESPWASIRTPAVVPESTPPVVASFSATRGLSCGSLLSLATYELVDATGIERAEVFAGEDRIAWTEPFSIPGYRGSWVSATSGAAGLEWLGLVFSNDVPDDAMLVLRATDWAGNTVVSDPIPIELE